ELSRLAAVVEEATVSAGFIPEERPIHPHLTLSRIRPPQDVRPLIDQVPVFPLIQSVTHVTVFESHLQRGPAVYAPLERFALH
ncbi:MAG: 2'-5' RNA ligase family protein, partial [Acidimicrobiia bacterium]